MDEEDKKKRFLTQEDQDLWREYTQGSESIEEAEEMPAIEDLEDEVGLPPEKATKAIDLPQESSVKTTKSPRRALINDESHQLDKRTDIKLKSGRMPIEGKLDLHGLTKAQAHEELNYFLQESHYQKKRTVLVVTGKGKSKSTSDDWLTTGQGVLKNSVPQWLNENPLRRIVLKFYQAQPNHGGSGALYVYLKRQR